MHVAFFRPFAVAMILVWTAGVPLIYAVKLMRLRAFLDPGDDLARRWVEKIRDDADARPPGLRAPARLERRSQRRHRKRRSSFYSEKRREEGHCDHGAFVRLVEDHWRRIGAVDDLLRSGGEEHEADASLLKQRDFLKGRLVLYLRQEVPTSFIAIDIKTCEFLWGPYKPAFYWWELVECGQRLLLSAVLSVLSPGSLLQVAIGLIIATLVMVVQIQCKPYAEDGDNAVAFGGAGVLTFTFFCALLLSDEFDVEHRGVLGWICISTNLLMILVSIDYVRRDCVSDVPLSKLLSQTVVVKALDSGLQRLRSFRDACDDDASAAVAMPRKKKWRTTTGLLPTASRDSDLCCIDEVKPSEEWDATRRDHRRLRRRLRRRGAVGGQRRRRRRSSPRASRWSSRARRRRPWSACRSSSPLGASSSSGASGRRASARWARTSSRRRRGSRSRASDDWRGRRSTRRPRTARRLL